MGIPAVVSSSFCVTHASQFVVEHKLGCGPDRYPITITDEERNLLFTEKPESGFLSRRKRRIYDAASGEVLVVIRHETPLCGKSSWVAFQGDSENESQVLFTLRRKRSGSWLSSRVLFEVFLPENNDSSNPDFSMEAKSWRSVYSVLSNGTPIAEGTKTGRAIYSVSVYPQVDRAFIAALSIIWILEYYLELSTTATVAATAAV